MTPRRRRRALGFEPALAKVIVMDPNRPEIPPWRAEVDLVLLRRNRRDLDPSRPGADDGELGRGWGVS